MANNMYGPDLDDLPGCMLASLLFPFILWVCWEVVDYFWIDQVFTSCEIIIPEIKLIINNNVVDTIYIYKQIK